MDSKFMDVTSTISKSEMLRRSTHSEYPNVVHLATYKKLKAFNSLKVRTSESSQSLGESSRKTKTDKERVAEIQKQNNNYKDKR